MVLLQLVVLLFCLSSQSFYMLYILLFLNQEKTIWIFKTAKPRTFKNIWKLCSWKHVSDQGHCWAVASVKKRPSRRRRVNLILIQIKQIDTSKVQS